MILLKNELICVSTLFDVLKIGKYLFIRYLWFIPKKWG